MASKAASLSDGFGFFTVVEAPNQGLVGGLLVLNAAARPLEFHCTAPVTANRAQQILYGPTLAPYLYGEQLGTTLLNAAKNRLVMIATDVEPALSLREFCDMPVLLVKEIPELPQTKAVNIAKQTIDFSDGPAASSSEGQVVLGETFTLRQREVALAATHVADRATVEALCEPLIESFDLTEPFQRIHEAIQEAQIGAA